MKLPRHIPPPEKGYVLLHQLHLRLHSSLVRATVVDATEAPQLPRQAASLQREIRGRGVLFSVRNIGYVPCGFPESSDDTSSSVAPSVLMSNEMHSFPARHVLEHRGRTLEGRYIRNHSGTPT